MPDPQRPAQDREDGPLRIEVVCTGNIARSPLAAALLDAEARSRLGPGAPVIVTSSGIHGWDRHPAVEGMQHEAAARGVDLSAHRSARTTPRRVGRADLVLTMTEQQRGAIHRSVPDAMGRTFTVREFARLARQVATPDGARDSAERARRIIAACHAARDDPVLRDENVDDPYGGSQAAYRRTADELTEQVTAVARVLFGA